MKNPSFTAVVLCFFSPMFLFTSVQWASANPVGCVGGAAEPALELSQAHPTLEQLEKAFSSAAQDFGVPVEIVKAVAYKESAWVHGGPTVDYGYGIMHLVDNDYSQTLNEAAALVGLSAETVKNDPIANIRAGVALIAKYAKETVGKPKTLEDYWDALKKFSGLLGEEVQEIQAQEYFDIINNGVTAENSLGMKIALSTSAVDISNKVKTENQISYDYSGAVWNPADSSNYSTYRGVAVDRWVNHWVGVGTYAGCISWFKNPASNVSAHFVIRSSDGHMTQMVRYAHKAWHCGNWNSRSIGIEHEATSANPGLWNSTKMLQNSANACRHVTSYYGFPRTRTYLVGHKEVPGASTSCPGPMPWTTWMNYVTGGTSPTNTPTPVAYAAHWVAQSYSSTMTSGTTAICWVEYMNDGTAVWSHAKTHLGTTQPRDRSSAFYTSYNWVGPNRPTEVDQSAVSKGQVGRFTFIMTAPNVATSTTYTEYWGLVEEGVTWFGPADNAVWFRITVNPSGPTATPTNTFTHTHTPTRTPTPFLPSQIIIDNPDPGWSDNGSPWATASGATDKYGVDYRYTSTNFGTRTSTWSHAINGGGTYKVYAWWPAGTNRSNNTPYIVHTRTGDTTVWVNQTLNGGAWNLLGTFAFSSLLSVSVSTEGAQTGEGKMVMADAVMFSLDGGLQTPTNTNIIPTSTPTYTPTRTFTNTPTDTPTGMITSTPTETPTETLTQPPAPVSLIVDNTDPGYSDEGLDSNWFTGSSTTNQYGADYRYNTSGTGLDTAVWTVEIPQAGLYEVSVWYPNGSNRANNAPFRVDHADGSSLFYVDQQYSGGQWNRLGTFNFAMGNYSVVLNDDAQDGQIVVADAIRWASVQDTPTPTNTPVTTPEGRAVWIDVFDMDSPAKIQTAISKAATNGMNAVICEIRYRGDALYFPNRTDSSYPNPEPRSERLSSQSPSFDPLQTAIDLGRNAGLQVHAWAVAYPAWSSATPPSDPDHVYNSRPDWITRDNNGNLMQVTDAEGAYLDPGRLDVQEYLANVFKDIIINYDVDGFHLDYIRYPQTSFDRSLDWGYNSIATDRFSEDTGQTAQPTNAAWQNWKRAQVSALVEDVWDFILANKPSIAFSCAVLGDRNTAEGWAFQHWSDWAQRPILDVVYPMCYSTDTSVVTSQAADAFANTGTRNVFIGLRAYGAESYNSSLLVEKVNLIRALPGFEQGKDGFAFFDSGGLQEQADAFYNALTAGPMADWQSMPPLPGRPLATPTSTFPATVTPTDTPTETPTETPSDTPTDTPIHSPTHTPTDTPTFTITNTPIHTSTYTWTPTNTPTNTPVIVEVTLDTTKDTHIRDYNDDFKGRNYGVFNRLLIGYYNGWGYYHQRTLVQFSVASIPSNVTILDAKIGLYQDIGAAHDNSNQSHAVHLYRITGAWAEGTANGTPGSVCWNDQPSINTTSLASLTINGVAAGTWREWTGASVVNLVQGWVTGSIANHGVMFRNSIANEEDDGAHKFYSREAGPNPPRLWVRYQLMPTPTPSDTPTRTPTPTITPTPTSFTTHEAVINATKDSHIRDYNDDYKARNYGTYNRLLIGYYNGWGFSRQRALVEFDLSSIPSNATVLESKVSLYQDVGAAHASSDQPHEVHVYRITTAWQEGNYNGSAGSVCWNDQPTINTISLGSLTINGVAQGTQRTWSSTALNNVVQGWINGSYANRGLMFRNSIANEEDDGAHKFYSAEQGSAPPSMYIKYALPLIPSNTPTNTHTATFTSAPTDTPTATATDTFTNTPTNTPMPTSTDTPTDTPTATDVPTLTWTPSHTPTWTSAPTETPTPEQNMTPTVTAVQTQSTGQRSRIWEEYD